VQSEAVGVNGRGVAGVCRDRNHPDMTGQPFIYIWEYEVAPGREAEFLGHYAPAGSWARLFRRAPGYLGTELYRDLARPDRFVTVDRWQDEPAFRDFSRRFANDYEALDRQCAGLTRHERPLGEFHPAADGGA
jgi:heme-degrading monooxygenase HmoA